MQTHGKTQWLDHNSMQRQETMQTLNAHTHGKDKRPCKHSMLRPQLYAKTRDHVNTQCLNTLMAKTRDHANTQCLDHKYMQRQETMQTLNA